jgi:DNA-binding Lrp family transcriptional regulator
LKPDLKEKQAKLAMLLQERGPRITEIARELGESPETVRYWFKNNILAHKGIAYQAVPNHRALGFSRIRAIIDFADEYLPHARDILISMSKLCFLSHYYRVFPSGYYSIILTVPSRDERYYVKLLEDLQDTGMFHLLMADHLDWIRVTPMKAKYFDFSKGRWDFDWSAVVNEKLKVQAFNSDDSIRYDYEDIRMLEKLQVDATRSMGEISRDLKISYQQAYNHFNHITERGQISLYRIMWPATGPRSQEELKAWQQHHAHMGLQFLVRNPTEAESHELLTKMERLPFNWANGGSEGNFLSDFVIPLEYYSETLQYLSEALQDSRGRTEFTVGDQANSLSFSIPSRLYDKEADTWTNNADDALARFKKLVLTVKGRQQRKGS